jgi:hypothetical protein
VVIHRRRQCPDAVVAPPNDVPPAIVVVPAPARRETVVAIALGALVPGTYMYRK